MISRYLTGSLITSCSPHAQSGRVRYRSLHKAPDFDPVCFTCSTASRAEISPPPLQQLRTLHYGPTKQDVRPNNTHKSSFYSQKHSVSILNKEPLILFEELITVYCENHIEHINTLHGQNAHFLNVKVITVLQRFNKTVGHTRSWYRC